ncbi:LLM class flavin-dependent oxidoreductase [Nocardia terpenica]|uniref:LLM class flavin-dependent oxidoreductase n=1 Tax=Nocardia terpenica TaxID=455432 RepID=UPI001896038A|nr:LLM class flavin-dependent oxidoreductase [Nocardia terpenica]MBF6061108.1 LLM class flavin-dependent oxidoreductase [Nocardia terpenica]MBF6105663.1 LLM class flavin-dependent oxidoreductase [Nocardia terpenica]MBF6112867.1 LLM class flavin-dependent oxidoreductase [Nocardia terpenica]MBF6118997.1 LLM class flavin-dependent oxidoreductase [Nocardia terpenica]
MRFAISIPQYMPDATFDASAMRRYLSRAEALRFESAWTQEQVLGSMPHLGPLETLSYAAACTERMRLGTAMLISSVHSPVHLAKSLSTLDQLSHGRLDVGIALGVKATAFSAFAVDPSSRVSRFTEGIRLMKACWTESEITFDGRFWQLDGAAMEPKPFQKPGPPIWFGGSHPAAVRRAVRYADAFMGAGSQTTDQFAGQVRILREALRDGGRDAAGFPVAKRVYIVVDDNVERARDRAVAGLERLYKYWGLTGEVLAPVAVFGSPEDCVRGLREAEAAGAELILLNPLDDDAEQMERLAAEVVGTLA